MAELKTKKTGESVIKFLEKIEEITKQKDCFEIVEMMKSVSKCEPKMWGTAIIGFDSYHYKYESGREGTMCVIGFSPRKQNITLYLMGAISEPHPLLAKLGKYKTGKGCLYINTLKDVDTSILKKLIKASFDYVKNKHG
jgi:Domain of unknown function (DU1801)